MRLDALAQLDVSHNMAATAVSQNAVDLTNPAVAIDLGNGEELEVIVLVDVAAVQPNGNETYQFQFVQSVNANLNNPQVLFTMPFGGANQPLFSLLVAGYAVHVPIPKGAITQRFIGMQYTLGGTAPSITVDAFIQPQKMVEQFTNYAVGYVVS